MRNGKGGDDGSGCGLNDWLIDVSVNHPGVVEGGLLNMAPVAKIEARQERSSAFFKNRRVLIRQAEGLSTKLPNPAR